MFKYLLGAVALGTAAVAALAQPGPFGGNSPFNWDRDFPRIFGRANNPDLHCTVQRRIDRRGDIIWLQMTCRR